MRIYNNLSSLMKNRGIKGKQLADLTEIPDSEISEGINGKRVFSDPQIEKLAAALHVTVEQMYPDDQLREALAE
ncbi:MAG: helix-turn-helix domain-containing protein [Candidatus Geothermincolia bacterium]